MNNRPSFLKDVTIFSKYMNIKANHVKKHRTYIKSLSFHRAVNSRDMRQADVSVRMQTMRANVLLCRKLKKERLFPAECS